MSKADATDITIQDDVLDAAHAARSRPEIARPPWSYGKSVHMARRGRTLRQPATRYQVPAAASAGEPFVASLIAWSILHDTVELAQRYLRLWGTRFVPALRASTCAAAQTAVRPVRYVMKRERLTRAQRKEQTIERLIEAARTMFVKKGLAATSVEDIAGAAGYTRGAFYSNFDGKPGMLLELLRRDHDSAQANLRVIVEEGGTREQIRARAIACYGRYFHDNDGFPLWLEARLLAFRDARFQERFNAFRREELEQVSTYIRTFSEQDDRPLPLRADALALGLVSLRDGVQLFRMCDPQMVSDEVMQTVLTGFVSCGLWRQSEEIPRADHRAGVSDRGRRMPTAGAGNIHDQGPAR